jgi:hypothetical protein
MGGVQKGGGEQTSSFELKQLDIRTSLSKCQSIRLGSFILHIESIDRLGVSYCITLEAYYYRTIHRNALQSIGDVELYYYRGASHYL